jgi:acetyl esterase/lipase
MGVYRPDTEGRTPVYVFIHGGGFRGGDKDRLPEPLLAGFLASGISVVAINYPLSDTDPFPAAMEHSRRAIQFIRYNADTWQLDASRVAAGGGSAGAGISMWIGFRGEEADPLSADPVARESTRLTCLAPWQGQCSYDLNFIRSIITGPAYIHDALLTFFRVTPDDLDLPEAKEKFRTASAITYATEGAPPVFIWFSTPNLPMDPPPDMGPGIHHPMFGFVLKAKLDPLGVECILRTREELPDLDGEALQARFHKDSVAFVKRHFKMA